MKTPLILGTALALCAALYVQSLHIGGSGEAIAALPKSNPADIRPLEIAPNTHKELELIFAQHDYKAQTLDKGIPKIVLATLPEDLSKVQPVARKKEVFFLSILPMALIANEVVLEKRDFLHSLKKTVKAGGKVSDADRIRFAKISDQYGVDGITLDTKGVSNLLTRVDTVPPSLVLAQAANESAWGTSRFALDANNLFGQWTFTPGTGLVPAGRPEGEIYEVRLFDNLQASVKSYIHNLNTHSAYKKFRTLRRELRAQNAPLKGAVLAQGLENYSTRREAYVKEIVSMIKGNDLARYSSMSLRPI